MRTFLAGATVDRTFATTNRLRTEGTRNLLDAAWLGRIQRARPR